MSDQASAPMGGDSNKFFGEYPGKVESIDDPDKLMRVQVRAIGVFPDKIPTKSLPWAEIMLPVGFRPNDGEWHPLKVGDMVWCSFPYGGDSRRPRVNGSIHYAPNKQPNMPHEAWNGPNVHSHKRTGEEPAPAAYEYHKDYIFTQNGVTVEMRKDGSYSVLQRSSGTEINISKDGDIVIHSENNIYRSAPGDSKAIITGDEETQIFGHQHTSAAEGIKHDGGTGATKGVVQGDCVCPYTRKPHIMVSSNVEASL